MTTASTPQFLLLRIPRRRPKQTRFASSDEKLASVPDSDIPEDFRRLSRFFRLSCLVPKSAVERLGGPERLSPNKSITDLTDTMNVCSPMDAANAWLRIQRQRHV